MIYYEHPGANSSLDYDFRDFGPGLGYDFGPAAVSLQYLWSPDYSAGSGDSHHVTGGVEVPFPEGRLPAWLGLGASANLGYQAIEKNNVFGTRDYLLWDVGTTVSARPPQRCASARLARSSARIASPSSAGIAGP